MVGGRGECGFRLRDALRWGGGWLWGSYPRQRVQGQSRWLCSPRRAAPVRVFPSVGPCQPQHPPPSHAPAAQGEAQSARLIGQAIQHNPSFIALRRIEVRRLPLRSRPARRCGPPRFRPPPASALCRASLSAAVPRFRFPSPPLDRPLLPQAARDIASTIAASANRVFLSADSLMLNLGDTKEYTTKK